MTPDDRDTGPLAAAEERACRQKGIAEANDGKGRKKIKEIQAGNSLLFNNQRKKGPNVILKNRSPKCELSVEAGF